MGRVAKRTDSPDSGDYPTTRDFVLAKSVEGLAQLRGGDLAISEVKILSPVTRNQQFICQGANYRQHMIELAMDPDAKKFNMIFTAPNSPLILPKNVRFLDYEIELGLISSVIFPRRSRSRIRLRPIRRGPCYRQRLFGARRADSTNAIL